MERIMQSLLDIDFYKFPMGQLVFMKYPDVPVTYALRNRTTSVHLALVVDEGELRRELDHVRTLRFNNTGLHYLRGTNEYGERMFREGYLEFLKGLQLPEYSLERVGDDYSLRFSGKWSEAIYWETIALAIVNELYFRTLTARMSRFEQDVLKAVGVVRLMEKVKKLKQHLDITITDFGTRRRYGRFWHEYVVGVLANELPRQLLGTSNVKIAMDLGLLPMGTSAHELFMVMAGIMHGSDDEIRSSHNHVLQDWWELYGWGLSIALTDTYGRDFFFRDMTLEQARLWKGLRQDSGDPFTFADSAISFYENFGIDPKEKLLIFSDGLDVDLIIRLAQHIRGRIRGSFGWGTNLTNDLGLKALSLVVKVVGANGHSVVKLSDNLAKATGVSEDIERFKEIFGYTATTYEECKY